MQHKREEVGKGDGSEVWEARIVKVEVREVCRDSGQLRWREDQLSTHSATTPLDLRSRCNRR